MHHGRRGSGNGLNIVYNTHMAEPASEGPVLNAFNRRKLKTPSYCGFLIADEGAPKNGPARLQCGSDHALASGAAQRASNDIYVAVALRTDPVHPADNWQWSILEVHVLLDGEQDARGELAVISQPTAPILDSLKSSLHQRSDFNASSFTQYKIPIYIKRIEPLALSRLVIEVDADALRKHDAVQAEYSGGFLHSEAVGFGKKRKGEGEGSVQDEVSTREARGQGLGQDLRIAKAIRDALTSFRLIAIGYSIPLPLPTHPITHAAFPSARVISCNPVRQGLLCPRTSIVVRSVSKNHNKDKERVRPFTEIPDLAYSSDESSDDAISIEPPQLLHTSTLSPGGSVTPRPFGFRSNVPGTPGSTLSAYTATSAGEGMSGRGRTFKASGLLQKVPEYLLNPSPAPDEDDGARVFVEMRALVQLRCFSGDWISIEPAINGCEGYKTSLAVEALTDNSTANLKRRPVKVYGISGLVRYGMRPHHIANGKGVNGNTFKESGKLLETWLSPVLLANLGNSRFVKLSKDPILARAGQRSEQNNLSGTEISPTLPCADEVTLDRISSPLSTDKAQQGVLLSQLKLYFELRRRIHKQGDLIALEIDKCVGRLRGGVSDASDTHQDIARNLPRQHDTAAHIKSNEVAWFRISHLHIKGPPNTRSRLDDPDWFGAAYVEPTDTPIGVEQGQIPSNTDSTWEFYFGCKSSPDVAKASTPIAAALSKPPAPVVLPTQWRLQELVAASVSPSATHLNLDPTVIILHSTQRSIGKSMLAKAAASALGLHIFVIDAYDLLAEGGSAEVDLIFQARVARALSCGSAYTVLHIRQVEALTSGRMIMALRDAFSSFRAVICTTANLDSIPDDIRALFTHEIEVSAPNEDERRMILQSIITERSLQISQEVSFSSLALKTAALVAGNLIDIVDRALIACNNRLTAILAESRALCPRKPGPMMHDLLLSADPSVTSLTSSDFTNAIDAARASFSDSIGAPKIPSVSWADVGGLAHVKDAVMETIQLPLSRPELFAKGMKKRSGILFYGPPGTGKTLLAKAIATEFSLNFFSIKGPELLNMYIGESEANVRRVFQRARDARPCVVFFDELDSVAPKRGNQGDSGGVMDRIVSQLLAELDGMSDSTSASQGSASSNGGVFVIGATNRPDLLDQALLRPGRLDKLLYLGVSDTHEKQQTILSALTRKFQLHPTCDLARIAERLPFTYTGADLYALCSDAMLKAVMRSAKIIDKRAEQRSCTVPQFFDKYAVKENLEVFVEEQDFERANRELVPSVSEKELDHYQRVRERFESPEEKAPVNGGLKKGKGKVIEFTGNPPTQPMFRDQASSFLSGQARRPKAAGRADTAIRSPLGNVTRDPQTEDLNRSQHLNGRKYGSEKERHNGYDDDTDDEDEGFVTSHDFDTPDRRSSIGSGHKGFGSADNDGDSCR